MILFIQLLFLLLGNSNPAAAHDIKLSLCTVEFDKTSALVSFRLFTDDLSTVIDCPLLDNPADEQFDQKIIEYLKVHFSIAINQQKQQLYFFSRSGNHEVIEMTFLINNLEEVSSLNFYNSIFLEKFEKQKNVIKINFGHKKQRFILDKNKTSIKL